MTTKVFKYGALSPDADGAIRQQIKLGREYYNSLVEAENARRKMIWGADTPPKPPHDHHNGDGKKCDECQAFWKKTREIYRATPPLDIKPLRAKAIATGLYWGSYLISEESFSAAWRKTDCYSLLKYKSWKQGGIAGIQIQRAAIPNTKYMIEHIDDSRTGRRKGQRHQIRIRVGSVEKKKPLWSNPIKFEKHRPIQGRVAWIKICMRYRGEREVWSVNITCTEVPERNDKAVNGVVAIDVGWRVIDSGFLRIAYAVGIDEKESEFALSQQWRELSSRADRIRGHRNDRLDVLKIARPEFKVLKNPSSVKRFIDRTESITMTTDLDTWCKIDRHLAQYESGCRRRSEESRRNAMRVWLRELRRNYKHVVIKNSSHKEMKDHQNAIKSGMLPNQRRNAHHAAPGEVIEEICKVWDRETEVAIIDAEYTTATCLACGHVNPEKSEQFLVCERCGDRRDRDRTSTRNLLVLYAKGEYKKPTTRRTTARFSKRHRNSSELSQCQRNGL